LVRSKSKEKLHPDFGTYHHSTSNDSVLLRKKIKRLSEETFGDLPFSRNNELKILDIGCGLGFLSCVCAAYYPKAQITGFDTFEDPSLKNSSLEKARTNAKILGFADRIKFQKKDFFQANYGRGKFDLFVANLVLHNFGRRRLIAYDRLARWTRPESYVLLGELFFDYRADFKRLTSLFGSVQERSSSLIDHPYRMLLVTKAKK
jgi:2-polyprenyl-3-methyl-5-hydroxy-6-metoxy-1,4-benzoquinol methylase